MRSWILKLRVASRHLLAHASAGAALASAVIMAVTPPVQALQLQLNGDAHNLRTPDGEKLIAKGVLASGSILQIPDEYTVRYDGNLNIEATIINWLQKSEAQPSHDEAKAAADTARAVPGSYAYEMNGKEGHADFYPITVAHAAPGSTLPKLKPGQQVFVSLLHMVRSGSVLVVDEDTPALISASARVAVQPPAAVAPVPAPQRSVPTTADPNLQRNAQTTEARACQNGCGRNPSDPMSQNALNEYINNVNAVLARSNNPTRIPVAGPALGSPYNVAVTDAIRRNIFRQCRDDRGQPVRTDDFLNQLKISARENGLPENLFVNIMTQESKGDCAAIGADGEIGSLQIKPSSSGLPECRGNGTAAQCRASLRNPRIAVRAAAHLFAENARILFKPSNSSGFNPASLSSADRYRLLTMAYSRGGKAVLKAKVALDSFNARRGTSLKAENWFELRPFVMAAYLEGRVHNVKSVARGIHYSEAMVPI